MAALGDERLFELLEDDGPAIARGEREAFDCGAVAEVVERARLGEGGRGPGRRAGAGRPGRRLGTAAAGRLALNLGHSLGHAVEAAGGLSGRSSTARRSRTGSGRRCRIGLELGVTPPARAARIGTLLDRLELGRGRLPYAADVVRDHLDADKKHAGGRLRWVLPTADGVVVRADVPGSVVDAAVASLLEAPAPAASGREVGGR